MPPEPAPLVRVEGLARAYAVSFGLRRRPALRGVDLEVRGGEVVALLGRNGSGKSTLLRAMAGIEIPDAGSVRIAGRPAGTLGACRLTGYCPEDAPFPPHLAARTCLRDLAALSGLRGADATRRIDAVLERFGLAAESRTLVGRLSRGQGRRLSIAQALLHEPVVVLLDEPTSGLDALGVVVLEEVLRELRGRGAAVVLSSHVGTDVDRMCTHVVALRDGAVAARGTVDEILGDPARREIVLESEPAGGWKDVERAAEAAGARLVASRPARRSLADLFRAWLAG